MVSASRRRLYFIVALFVLFFSAKGLWSMNAKPVKPIIPDLLVAGAIYRPDGGQAIGAADAVPINPLTGLNLGIQIDPLSTNPAFMGQLSGLGPKTSARAGRRGCLTAHERRYLEGLITGEPCL